MRFLSIYVHFIHISLPLFKITGAVQCVRCNARRARCQHQRATAKPTRIPYGILDHRTANGKPTCGSVNHHILYPHLAACRGKILAQCEHSHHLAIISCKEKVRSLALHQRLQPPCINARTRRGELRQQTVHRFYITGTRLFQFKDIQSFHTCSPLKFHLALTAL